MNTGVEQKPPNTEVPHEDWETRLLRLNNRIFGFCLVLFALMIGLILMTFPWTLSWELNWIPVHEPQWAELWMNHYFRGAVSGLGLLNVYVACTELIRQIREIFSH